MKKTLTVQEAYDLASRLTDKVTTMTLSKIYDSEDEENWNKEEFYLQCEFKHASSKQVLSLFGHLPCTLDLLESLKDGRTSEPNDADLKLTLQASDEEIAKALDKTPPKISYQDTVLNAIYAIANKHKGVADKEIKLKWYGDGCFDLVEVYADGQLIDKIEG